MRSSSRAVLAGSVLVLLLAACGGSKNEKSAVDYTTPGVDTTSKKSGLAVPPDLITPARDDRYVVPDGNPRASATYSGYAADRQPAAAASAVAATPLVQSDKLRIERVGGQRWLALQGDTETLWPKLRDFWKNYGLVLVTDDPKVGVQETEWASNRAKIKGDPIQSLLSKAMGTYYSTDERDKFRLRVEKSSKPGMLEIYITHRGMVEVRNGGSQDGTHWEPRPTDVNLEGEMLQRLMVSLGAEETVAKQQVADSLKPQADRASLSNAADGSLQLTTNDPMDRGWRQVGLALDRVGVVVEDRDRAKGIYFVRYVVTKDPLTQKEENGWFSSLAFWRSKKDSGTDQFRVVVGGDAQKTVVSLLNKEGAAAPAASAKQILNLLYNELK
ncbi:MAG: hypothetical protein H6R19_2444 [Proteobacteria bacterium]|nr:hypothetical protein [Pseudomonadota bacterium]